MPTIKEALNEYFKLKSKFENELSVSKKKIINNQTLSKREKRSEFLKLMPKCVNCKKPSKRGTVFSIVHNPETDTDGAYRKFSASCGNMVDPCNLDIEIHLGDHEPLDKLMRNIRDEIKLYKNKIIDDKNRLLFGLITTETALENFDLNKNYINELTSVYEMYLEHWNKMIDNPDKKVELDDSLVLAYENITKIKDCMKKMNETDDVQFAVDAANIYTTALKPILDKVRHLKYSENMVYHDDYTNKCRLIQRPYTENDMIVTVYTDKVVKFNFGLEAKKVKKNNPVIILSDTESDDFLIKRGGNIPYPSNKSIIRDNPIFGKGNDGIDWNSPEYKALWNLVPLTLKNEFKTNIEWMKLFMENCVNHKDNEQFHNCKLPTPPNLILPPKQMNNGQYDFGVSIYNKVFNIQPKSVQSIYLSYYKEDPSTKSKNYSQLEDVLNKLVEIEVSKDSNSMIFE